MHARAYTLPSAFILYISASIENHDEFTPYPQLQANTLESILVLPLPTFVTIFSDSEQSGTHRALLGGGRTES